MDSGVEKWSVLMPEGWEPPEGPDIAEELAEQAYEGDGSEVVDALAGLRPPPPRRQRRAAEKRDKARARRVRRAQEREEARRG